MISIEQEANQLTISLLFSYEQVAKRIANIRLTRSKKMKRKILRIVIVKKRELPSPESLDKMQVCKV